MINVLFVCYGNICRSTMAEFLFKDYVDKKGQKDKFCIESAATSSEEVGSRVHEGTRRILDGLGIDCSKKKARKIVLEDYKKFDYVIGMDEQNVRDLKRFFGGDPQNKISKILDFTDNSRDVIDPWFGWVKDGVGDFETTYKDIMKGLKCFWDYLNNTTKIG